MPSFPQSWCWWQLPPTPASRQGNPTSWFLHSSLKITFGSFDGSIIFQMSCLFLQTNPEWPYISFPGHRNNMWSKQIYSLKNLALGFLNSSEYLLGLWIDWRWKARSREARFPNAWESRESFHIVQRGRRMRGCSLGSWEKAAPSPHGDEQRQRCFCDAQTKILLSCFWAFECYTLFLPYPPLFYLS